MSATDFVTSRQRRYFIYNSAGRLLGGVEVDAYTANGLRSRGFQLRETT